MLLDQASKGLAVRLLAPNGSTSLFGDWLRLTYHENTGAAFGMFGGGVRYLAAFSWIFIVGLAWFLASSRRSALPRGALVVILAGAAGNAIDRIRLGYVVDFIDLGFWPIFNIADSAITLGVAWLVASSILKRKAAV